MRIPAGQFSSFLGFGVHGVIGVRRILASARSFAYLSIVHRNRASRGAFGVEIEISHSQFRRFLTTRRLS